MKKLMLTILFISLTFTLYADKSSYASDLSVKCKKTKNRKVCLRAIRAELALTNKIRGTTLTITSKKNAYLMIKMMLDSPCRKGSTWSEEACKLQRYYRDKWYDEAFKYHSKESRENWGK